eukprot:364427-Chlamydomonas_euryale.AAC.1
MAAQGVHTMAAQGAKVIMAGADMQFPVDNPYLAPVWALSVHAQHPRSQPKRPCTLSTRDPSQEGLARSALEIPAKQALHAQHPRSQPRRPCTLSAGDPSQRPLLCPIRLAGAQQHNPHLLDTQTQTAGCAQALTAPPAVPLPGPPASCPHRQPAHATRTYSAHRAFAKHRPSADQLEAACKPTPPARLSVHARTHACMHSSTVQTRACLCLSAWRASMAWLRMQQHACAPPHAGRARMGHAQTSMMV